jgi:hypothetical protein
VVQLFFFQGKSGIWPKYFPLFNYPADGTLNYCFTFEFLEAILTEFSDSESRLWKRGAGLIWTRRPWAGWLPSKRVSRMIEEAASQCPLGSCDYEFDLS